MARGAFVTACVGQSTPCALRLEEPDRAKEPLTPSVAASVLPRELQSSRSPPRALLALDAGFPLPPGPDLPPRRLKLDDLLAQDAFHRIGLVHGRFPDRARGRLCCAPFDVRALGHAPFHPARGGRGLVSGSPSASFYLALARFASRLPSTGTKKVLLTDFCNLPTTRAPAIVRFSSDDDLRLRRPRRALTLESELDATPARLAATRPRVRCA